MVTVVAYGPAGGRNNVAPVLVRNNTPQPVEAMHIDGTASYNGATAATGHTATGTVPFIIGPGQLAVAQVGFDQDVSRQATYAFTVSQSSSLNTVIDLKVGAVTNSGGVMSTTVTNPGSQTVNPADITFVCLSPSGQLLAIDDTYGQTPSGSGFVGPGVSATGSVTFATSCAGYLVGAAGPVSG